MRPDLVPSASIIPDGRSTLEHALSVLSKELGFTPDSNDPISRMVYLPGKTWRRRIFGTLKGKPVSLRIDTHKLPVEEETMRDKFRAQPCVGKLFPVRPPETYDWQPYDDKKGYGWSLDEVGGEQPLFLPDADPGQAAAAFLKMYHELHSAIRKPFWHPDIATASELSRLQAVSWRAMSKDLVPGVAERHAVLLNRLERAFVSSQEGKPTHFMHAHLAGLDVRCKDNQYIVFANHFWSWRQPGYDITFAIWWQWMSLPPERRTAEEVANITMTWMRVFQLEWPRYAEGVEAMLLNRCFGALLLDIPLKGKSESPDASQALEQAIVAEAERLLAE